MGNGEGVRFGSSVGWLGGERKLVLQTPIKWWICNAAMLNRVTPTCDKYVTCFGHG
jgi:hypothetical protein